MNCLTVDSIDRTWNSKVTAIIPLRITDHVYEARLRLERILRYIPADSFEVLIVDYGTPASHQAELEGLGSNVTIIRTDTGRDIFSIGHARDIGVQHAATDVVMFHDIDFLCTTSMYRKIR